MITIRRSVFETNSSSTHTLTIISNDTYQRWRDHEIVIKFVDVGEDLDLDSGDNGFLGTWGNFFLHQEKAEIADISAQRRKNIEALEEALYDWVYLNFPEEEQRRYLNDLGNYKVNGEIGYALYEFAGDRLYLTPEEYKKSLNFDDCDSPFLYQDLGVVVIGHYFRS